MILIQVAFRSRISMSLPVDFLFSLITIYYMEWFVNNLGSVALIVIIVGVVLALLLYRSSLRSLGFGRNVSEKSGDAPKDHKEGDKKLKNKLKNMAEETKWDCYY
jgi:hypothetical protein